MPELESMQLPSRGLRSRLQANRLHRPSANSGWLLFDRLARALLGLLVGHRVVRHLGPPEFSTLVFVLASIVMFLPLANLSADQIVVRNVSQAAESTGELLGSTSVVRRVLSAVCWRFAILEAPLSFRGNGRLGLGSCATSKSIYELKARVLKGTAEFTVSPVVFRWNRFYPSVV